MSKKWLCLFALSACCFASHAQNPVRVDYCNADPLSRRVADATALLVPKTQIRLNPGGTTYTMDTTPFTAPFGGRPICSDQPYYNQLRALQGRTGFLIGPHTVMTAAHGPMATYFDPADYAMVFNWRWIEDGPQPQTSPDRDCRLQSDPSAIPFNDVYFPAIFPSPIPPGDPYNTRESINNPTDFMIFQLGRDVSGVTPLPLRRSGEPLLGDALIVPGHALVLPLKIASGARVVRSGPNGIATGQPMISQGNSGSPVFNARAQLVETVISRGEPATTWSPDPLRGCDVEYDNVVALGAETNTVENSSVKAVPDLELPSTTALQVAPLNVVRHTVVGGSATNQTSSFTVSLPAAAPAAVNYKVSAGNVLAEDHRYIPSAVAATLIVKSADGTSVGGSVQTIAPGQSQRYTVDVASVPNDCEQTETEVRIRPLVAGAFDSVITHRFETNQRNFIVSPDTDWVLNPFVPPFPTRTVTVRNPTTINQSITVASSAPWLLVNGVTSTTVTIAPQGSPGDTATLTLSIAATADIDVPPGTTGHARVTANAGNTRCQERAAEEIDVAFTNGVLDLYVPDASGTILPAPGGGATYGTPVEATFDLSAYTGLLVGDVDVGPSFYVLSPSLPSAVPPSLMVEVDSPNPGGSRHVVQVWDGQTPPAGYFPSIALDVYRLYLDDETTPPLAGTLLSAFDNEGVAGTWKVRLYNRSTNMIVRDGVRLRVVRKP